MRRGKQITKITFPSGASASSGEPILVLQPNYPTGVREATLGAFSSGQWTVHYSDTYGAHELRVFASAIREANVAFDSSRLPTGGGGGSSSGGGSQRTSSPKAATAKKSKAETFRCPECPRDAPSFPTHRLLLKHGLQVHHPDLFDEEIAERSAAAATLMQLQSKSPSTDPRTSE